ncbi:MAG: hypothetical protein MMC33_000558 [Icmadophila ericetorum]|nr:hypothetical protein [Icmadophila ericetorum]
MALLGMSYQSNVPHARVDRSDDASKWLEMARGVNTCEEAISCIRGFYLNRKKLRSWVRYHLRNELCAKWPSRNTQISQEIQTRHAEPREDILLTLKVQDEGNSKVLHHATSHIVEDPLISQIGRLRGEAVPNADKDEEDDECEEDKCVHEDPILEAMKDAEEGDELLFVIQQDDVQRASTQFSMILSTRSELG